MVFLQYAKSIGQIVWVICIAISLRLLYLDFHLDEKMEQMPVPSPTEHFKMIEKRSEMMVTLDLVVSLSVLMVTLVLNVMSNYTYKQFSIVVEVLHDGPSPKDEYSVRYGSLVGMAAVCCTTVSGTVAMLLAFILVGRPPAEFDVWYTTYRRYILAVYGFFAMAILLFGGQFFGQFMIKDPELHKRDPDLWTPMTAVAGVMTFLVIATTYRKHQLSIRAIAAQTTISKIIETNT